MGDRPGPKPVILASSDDVDGQIVELFAALGDAPRFEPFTRCLECNALLVEAPEEAVKGRVPPNVEKNFHRFHRCPACGRDLLGGKPFPGDVGRGEGIEAKLKKR